MKLIIILFVSLGIKNALNSRGFRLVIVFWPFCSIFSYVPQKDPIILVFGKIEGGHVAPQKMLLLDPLRACVQSFEFVFD